MTQVTQPQLPIGFWLKRADSLLTEQINKAQAAHGLSRSEWQVLNMLHGMGNASRERLVETMRTFVEAPDLDEILTGLTERGWIEQSSSTQPAAEGFQLTEEGRHQHGISLAKQKEIRQQAMRGISEEEYATVIQVLQRLVSNLEENNENAGQ